MFVLYIVFVSFSYLDQLPVPNSPRHRSRPVMCHCEQSLQLRHGTGFGDGQRAQDFPGDGANGLQLSDVNRWFSVGKCRDQKNTPKYSKNIKKNNLQTIANLSLMGGMALYSTCQTFVKTGNRCFKSAEGPENLRRQQRSATLP